MYSSRTISQARSCACCGVNPCWINLVRNSAISSFVFSLRLQQHFLQLAFGLQFAHHFGAVFAPVFLGHHSVLCQCVHNVGGWD